MSKEEVTRALELLEQCREFLNAGDEVYNDLVVSMGLSAADLALVAHLLQTAVMRRESPDVPESVQEELQQLSGVAGAMTTHDVQLLSITAVMYGAWLQRGSDD